MAMIFNLHLVANATAVLTLILAFSAISSVVTSTCTAWPATCTTYSKDVVAFVFSLLAAIIGVTIAVLRFADTQMQLRDAPPRAAGNPPVNGAAVQPLVPQAYQQRFSFFGDEFDRHAACS
jgi:hypothetical protein